MLYRLACSVILAVCFLTAPVHANYALFTDVTDTIRIDGNTVLGDAATYEVRLQLLGPGGRIFNEWDYADEDKMLDLTDGTLRAYSRPINRPIGGITHDVSLELRTWHHLAYVYDGTQERLYLDGQLLTQRAASGNISDFANSVASVGGFLRDGFRPSFIGLLDTIRISSVARYAGDSFVPPAGDLVPDADTQLLFNFTEDSNSLTVADTSPNAIIGTLGAGFDGATAPMLIADLPIVGDLNFDGFVGLDDLDLILANWNQDVPAADFHADPSGDGFVGLDDLDIVLNNWNAGNPPASDVPEPITATFMLVAALSLLRRVG